MKSTAHLTKAFAGLPNGGGDYADEVRAEEEKYQAMGIYSVPSIIVDNRYLLTGAQPVEAFEEAIRQILAEA